MAEDNNDASPITGDRTLYIVAYAPKKKVIGKIKGRKIIGRVTQK